MSTLNAEIPEPLLRRAESLAQERGVPLDQFVATVLAQNFADLDAENFIRESAARRAQRANKKQTGPAPDDPDDGFADYSITINFQSADLSPEEFTSILKLRPTKSRVKGVPWPEGGGEERHRMYFQMGRRLKQMTFAFEQLEKDLRGCLQPFADRAEALAEIRQRCERITILCYARTSGNCAMTPLSAETLRLLAGLGFEFQLIGSTRAVRDE